MPDHGMDEIWMGAALSLARTAGELGEVPVGALVVKDGQVLGTGFNLRESAGDVTRHAEIEAIQAASRVLGSWRLTGCTLYVTLEPCLMCAGAIYQARVAEVVYGARDPKAGAMGSLYEVHGDTRLNHRVSVRAGIREEECGGLLRDFFRARR